MEINYLDIIVKKDLIIDDLKKKIKDKEYECGMITAAHDGAVLRESHQNGELRDMTNKYNKMTDMCKEFDMSFKLLSIAIYDYLNCKDGSYDLEKQYEKVLESHDRRLFESNYKAGVR